MAIGIDRRAVGVFSRQEDAQTALGELRRAGYPMDRVSVIAQNPEEAGNMGGAKVQDTDGNKADEGAAAGALTGGAIGGITGLLVGLGALAIPGIGPVMLAGATATTIATTLSGTAIGAVAGGLIGALIGLGIPEERARVYNDRVSQGHYLVIVDGTDDDIRRADAILNRRGIQEWGVYDIPEADATRASYTSTTATTVPTATTTTTTTSVPHDRNVATGTGSDFVKIVDKRDEVR